jgi:hypothetical protein
MLTLFLMVQIGVNVALTIALFLFLRERQVRARLALDREDRLEALAAEFCALGQALVAETPTPTRSTPVTPRPAAVGQIPGDFVHQSSRRSGHPAIRPSGNWRIGDSDNCHIAQLPDCQIAQIGGPHPGDDEVPSTDVTRPGMPSPGPPDRLRAAAALLDRGLPVEAVAARTAVPDGEIQVLRNLLRSQVRSAEPASSSGETLATKPRGLSGQFPQLNPELTAATLPGGLR